MMVLIKPEDILGWKDWSVWYTLSPFLSHWLFPLFLCVSHLNFFLSLACSLYLNYIYFFPVFSFFLFLPHPFFKCIWKYFFINTSVISFSSSSALVVFIPSSPCIAGIEIVWAIKDKHMTANFIDPGAAEFLRSELSKEKGDVTGPSKRRKYTVDEKEVSFYRNLF